MMGWAAFAEIEHEEFKKQQEQAQSLVLYEVKRGNIEKMFCFL